MISRRMHARIGWMTGVALFCAAPVFAQSTPNTTQPTNQSTPGTQPNDQTTTPTPQPNGQVGTQGVTGTQSTASASGTGSTGPSSGDKHFVKEATEGSNAEVALGKLAQEKSNSQDVKQFGERMVTDHTKLNEQMAPVAQQMGITASPDDIPSKEKALQTKLQALSGDDFDKAYIQAMVKDHTQDVKKFKHELSSTKDPTLKQTVQQGLEVIQQHLQMAHQLAQAHNVSVGGGAGSGTSQ